MTTPAPNVDTEALADLFVEVDERLAAEDAETADTA